MSNDASRFRVAASVLVTVALWILASGAAVADPHPGSSHHHANEDECVCRTVESSNGWCKACGVGYVASLRIPSALLFELLDPHGHEVEGTAVSCPTCLLAFESDGFCEEHGVGFVDHRGYVTHLTYLLARGEPVRESGEYRRLVVSLKLLDTCEYCALASFANGRCPKCNIHYLDGNAVADTTEEASR